MTKANFLVIYCLFISGLCCMANVTKDINMRFKDVRQGLSHQTVNCFYQDEFGFLWIGTQDGLNLLTVVNLKYSNRITPIPIQSI